jgi:hypothetical protein
VRDVTVAQASDPQQQDKCEEGGQWPRPSFELSAAGETTPRQARTLATDVDLKFLVPRVSGLTLSPRKDNHRAQAAAR